jgi:uncharacterized protein (TIGR03435 family)
MRSLYWLVAALIVLACLAFASSAAAQSTPAATPPAATASPTISQFEVAAIHLHQPQPHEHNSIWSSPFDGHFKAANSSVVMLVRWACEIPETRILGAPAWAATTYFDIDAKADPAIEAALHQLTSDAGRKQKEKMVQELLADRFKLVAHTEIRELPIYKLVIARGGAKFGDPKSSGTTVNHGRDHIEVEGANSAALLAEELSTEVGRDVVDKTGITGRYNLKLQWTPDDRAAPAQTGSPSAADSGPSIFTALEEQLGLKLEPQKGPVTVLVIDHVEMPSAN